MIEHVEIGIRKAGGITKLAAGLGIRHPSLHSWKRIPAGRVISFEQISGISRHVLRPDLYPLNEEHSPFSGSTAAQASAVEPYPIPETVQSQSDARAHASAKIGLAGSGSDNASEKSLVGSGRLVGADDHSSERADDASVETDSSATDHVRRSAA